MMINLSRNFIVSLVGLPQPIKIATLIFLDALICISSIWIAFYLRTDEFSFAYQNQASISFLAFVIYIIFAYRFGIHRELTRNLQGNLVALFLKCFLLYGITFFAYILTIGFEGVPRSIGLIQPAIFFILLLVQRSFLKKILDKSNKSSQHNKKKVLIYGAGSAGQQVASIFRVNKLFEIVGFIDDANDMHRRTINGLGIHKLSELDLLLYKDYVSEVWLAIPSVDKNRRSQIITSLKGRGVRIRTIPDIKDLITGERSLSSIQELDMDDLLGRTAVSPNKVLLERPIFNKTIIVTGAGGSIGSEIVRQAISLNPKKIILLDHAEFNLHQIHEELKSKNRNASIKIVPILCSVQDEVQLEQIFSAHSPDIIFHAAAYKHVPLVEENIAEAIKNNIFGTLNCAIVSQKYNVSNFVLVSTDKAVRPTSIMGATKRVAEMVLQSLNNERRNDDSTIFSMVRFGNVLDSSGSVVPLFRSQINRGGPITLTHKDVTRYFMTIPEAAQLVIQSAGMATGGDLFILDMGEPVLIRELATRMIDLSGLTLRDEMHPEGDIEIQIVGLRPGEKLFEELLIAGTPEKTAHSKIMRTTEDFIDIDTLKIELIKISDYLSFGNDEIAGELLRKLATLKHKA